MAEPIRVLFLPASGEGVGGGHVLRCLALADALGKAGAHSSFAVEPEGRRLLSQFGADIGIACVERPTNLAGLASRLGADALVIDDYAMAAEQEQGLTEARLLVAIDDLADRPHVAGLLIDPSYGRDAEDYAPLLPPAARVLAGPAYALLRREFHGAHAVWIRPTIGRVFVSFGLADPNSVTVRAIAALLPALPDARFDVALGSQAQSLPDLRRLTEQEPRLHLHVESGAVAAIMAGCDMAVGAGGSSTWERAVLGLPSISVVVADNQGTLAHTLAREGAQITLDAADPDFEQALAQAASSLAADPDLRRRLADRSRALCDGRGAQRVAQAIVKTIADRRGG